MAAREPRGLLFVFPWRVFFTRPGDHFARKRFTVIFSPRALPS
jgi:hypothetical protein